MGFSILGSLSVCHEGRDITPTAPKVRQVLAFLLVRRNQIVQVSEFIDELWGSNPPGSAMTTLQTYIYKLRRDVLELSGLANLHTQSCGYLLDVADEKLDLCRFESLSWQGRAAQEAGETARACELLSESLGLWRGRALSGVTTGQILTAHVARLEEKRLRVLGMRIEGDMLLGRYEELVSELKGLVRAYPLHERFHANLMTALNRSGRRYEAFEVYGQLRDLLADELGLEPSASVQRLYQSLLHAEPADGPASPSRTGTARPAPPAVVPAQLPADTPDFTGRTEMLDRVRRMLTVRHGSGTTARAVSICGMAGVGKTTLALHAAHVDKAQFPDGQLYADLRGPSPRGAAAPTDVLAGFLRALGVPEHQVPPTIEERSSLFRTVSDGKRLLVVLDDALSASQIAPLIPATPTSGVVVTSRWGLQDLPGVRVMKLDVMRPEESLELLCRMLGRDRVAAERDQAERIIHRCGNLPLALRCVGARLAAAPTLTLHRMAALLETGPAPLDQLRFAEFDVRASQDKTYFRLASHDRSALRLISLLPPPTFTVATAASLLGVGADAVEDQLGRLVNYHLLEATSDRGTDTVRYQLHRLVRLYARERLNREFIRPMSA
ncbi:AfsR/SARP family transcriptional regulator [Micromonospora sp. RTGN7]|uniref:AfsR/SARP family transcriptional regulator n=1 Tax=Micromonospora sp. RTGN7 TaxID=3016526 RepID=UPI0029FF208A|nr:BTAD domain-containing putative transcriptional regulator [Micromonospora sp. RTGN7]